MPSLHQVDCDKAQVLFYYQAHFGESITKPVRMLPNTGKKR